MREQKYRQNLMFSATFSPEIKKIAEGFMNEYIFISNNKDLSANLNITQTIYYVQEEEKLIQLHSILQEINGNVISKVIIIIHLNSFPRH